MEQEFHYDHAGGNKRAVKRQLPEGTIWDEDYIAALETATEGHWSAQYEERASRLDLCLGPIIPIITIVSFGLTIPILGNTTTRVTTTATLNIETPEGTTSYLGKAEESGEAGQRQALVSAIRALIKDDEHRMEQRVTLHRVYHQNYWSSANRAGSYAMAVMLITLAAISILGIGSTVIQRDPAITHPDKLKPVP